MGEASPEEGGWRRWGWALLVTTLVHVGVVAVGLVASGASAGTRASAPREPELVFLSFAAPPPAAGCSASAVAAAPERVRRQARARVSRPASVPTPAPVRPPKPVAPPVEEAPEPSAEAVEAPASAQGPEAREAVGTGAVGAVVAGVVGGVLGGQEGGWGTARGGEALELRQVGRAPAVLQQVRPSYPHRARSRGVEGLVLVRLIIGTDGHVEPDSPRVLRSVPELDAAALAAVTRWRFTPALGREGQPVRVIVEIPVQFSLK